MEKKRKIIIMSVIVVIALIIGFSWIRAVSTKKTTSEVRPTEELIPTVESSVKIGLESKAAGREVVLTIANIPNGTESIEYSLSYSTKQQGLQGVIGTLTVPSGSNTYEKEITLGTCSSGTCVYHEVDGAIKLTLQFSGSYGQKLFEKEYTL